MIKTKARSQQIENRWDPLEKKSRALIDRNNTDRVCLCLFSRGVWACVSVCVCVDGFVEMTMRETWSIQSRLTSILARNVFESNPNLYFIRIRPAEKCSHWQRRLLVNTQKETSHFISTTANKEKLWLCVKWAVYKKVTFANQNGWSTPCKVDATIDLRPSYETSATNQILPSSALKMIIPFVQLYFSLHPHPGSPLFWFSVFFSMRRVFPLINLTTSATSWRQRLFFVRLALLNYRSDC